MSLFCGFCMERGKAGSDTAVGGCCEWRARVVRGRAPGDGNREVLSTDAEPAGGPARSSVEAPVMGVERRGRLIWVCSREQPGDVLGGDE